MYKSEHPYPPEIDQLSPNQRAFLAAYARAGTLVGASAASGCSRTSHYQWLTDSVYRGAFEQAKLEASEFLEAEARRRAVDGVQEPVFYQGQICGYVMKYSDALLIKLLQANLPEKFKDRVETTQVLDADISKWSDSQLAQFLAYVETAAASKAPLRPAEVEILKRIAGPAEPAPEPLIDAQAEPTPELQSGN